MFITENYIYCSALIYVNIKKSLQSNQGFMIYDISIHSINNSIISRCVMFIYWLLNLFWFIFFFFFLNSECYSMHHNIIYNYVRNNFCIKLLIVYQIVYILHYSFIPWWYKFLLHEREQMTKYEKITDRSVRLF